jgi:hypothetical protein
VGRERERGEYIWYEYGKGKDAWFGDEIQVEEGREEISKEEEEEGQRTDATWKLQMPVLLLLLLLLLLFTIPD